MRFLFCDFLWICIIEAFREGEMMVRTIVFAAAISVIGSIPVSAQNFKGSCREFCQQNRCSRGAANMVLCMQKCVPFCKQKNPKAKD